VNRTPIDGKLSQSRVLSHLMEGIGIALTLSDGYQSSRWAPSSGSRRRQRPAPFGGFKHSGVGREFGIYGIEAFLEPRAIPES